MCPTGVIPDVRLMARFLDSPIAAALRTRRAAGIGLGIVAVSVVAFVWLTGREGGLGQVRAPVVDSVDAAERLAPLPPSLLSVPVELDLAPMIAQMEQAVPAEWGDLVSGPRVVNDDTVMVCRNSS